MTRSLLLFSILLGCFILKGQSSIEGHVSYGTYLMPDLKEILKDNTEALGNSTEVVYNFPPYWGYEFGYKYKFKNVLYKFDMVFGMVASYNSTGGRLSAKDYSGEILQDMLVNVVAVGPNVRFIESGEKKWKMGFEFATLAGVTTLTTENSLRVGNINDSDKTRNTYISTLIDTYWVTEYSLSEDISFVSRFGYQIDVSLASEYDTPSYSSYTGQRMQPDWTGLRGSVGVSYSF